MNGETVILVQAPRARLMRRDIAEILARLFFAQRSLLISEAGWVPDLDLLENKAAIAEIVWQDSRLDDAVRTRILELRYPRKDISPTLHRHVINLFDQARNSPTAEAFLSGLARVLKPALLKAFFQLEGLSDPIADGPTLYLVRNAIRELQDQIAKLDQISFQALDLNPDRRPEAEAWAHALSNHLDSLGETILDESRSGPTEGIELPGQRTFEPAHLPVRDHRFKRVRFYWPHIIDPSYPSGDGISLQLRSAIGHLNEVWACEMVAVSLYRLADQLGWDFILDSARWAYDESRHCLMGYNRLTAWGFNPTELPLGDYVYTSARDQEPIIGIGMLHYFETKYITRTRERIEVFANYHDSLSQHDYEFDWADETYHAEYGRRWLTVLLKERYQGKLTLEAILRECERLVNTTVSTTTEQESSEIHALADHLLKEAHARVEA